MEEGPAPAIALEQVRAYHERTKHQRERYARGPETIDWSAPPDPFRRFDGAPFIELPLGALEHDIDFSRLGRADVAPQPLSAAAVGTLLELSFGLSAWKEAGPDRWVLRNNPSSGNLHPTEAYVLAQRVDGLPDGLHHYDPLHHGLSLRCEGPESAASGLWLGLSSIHWREAWKYGERAFRYCQLDAGHALGALRYAAACLGWRVQLHALPSAVLAALLGLDRREDFLGVEPEEPEFLVQILPAPDATPSLPALLAQPAPRWHGRASRLDPHPMYAWPVIDEVAEASRRPADAPATPVFHPGPAVQSPLTLSLPTQRAAALIRQRRSAQQFDRRHVMPAGALWSLLAALQPAAGLPWDAWPAAPRVHAVLFVHRVEGLAPGLYAFPRSDTGLALMRASLDARFAWTPVAGAPAGLPLYLLHEGAVAAAARTLSCGQAIAADCCVAWGLLAEYDGVLHDAPWRYRELHREAGLLGQVLYLQAEAQGLRGTGIGCFFDDAAHQTLGLSGSALQTVYHFSVGRPLLDERIRSLPPYPPGRYAGGGTA